jgi:type II secretory ATPase GspE/PulE/Tfp pilus assembly ATPase PilB-like protein
MPLELALSAPDAPSLPAALGSRVNLLDSWPAPPLSPWAEGELGTNPERARLEVEAGHRVAGTAILFGPLDGVLFRPERQGSRERWVPAHQVRALSLTRPLALAAPPADAAALRRRYRLELVEGRVREGESAGAVRTEEGLFLFPPAGEASVARVFYPAARIRAFDWVGRTRGHPRLELSELAKPAVPVVEHRMPETVAELQEALRRFAKTPIVRLGEALIEFKLIDAGQLAQALERQKDSKDKPLGMILVEMGALNPDQLKGVIAQKLGIPQVDPRRFAADREALSLVPRAQCQRHKLVPLCFNDEGGLVVAMDNPMCPEALGAVQFASGRRPVPVLAHWSDIRTALGSRDVWAAHAKLGPPTEIAPPVPAEFSAKPVTESTGTDAIEFDLAGIAELTNRLTRETPVEDDAAADSVRESDSTLVRLVNKIIMDAHESGASDIHVEPGPDRQPTRIRMRRDGVLGDYAEVPAKFRAALVSRVKIMANLDISERRKPQDGKIDFSRFGSAKLELRVATIPTVSGLECVILRLLAAAEPLPAEKLGLEPKVLAQIRYLAERPHGLLLVAGPTGSGKTTTLHSIIKMINTPERKIWTAEDPVEITQEGLSQVHVNPKIGWTFAGALRSFLRADPDVIMIGEMRDRETAETAVEASLTGHLVFSTLHTNSAPETVTRLLDLGVDPFNFGDSLLGVLAQRLLRRVCPECATRVQLSDEGAERLSVEYAEGTSLEPHAVLAGWRERHSREGERLSTARGTGCDACSGSGYRGRIGVHEFMPMTPALRKLVHGRAESEALRGRAIGEGMRTLRQDAIEKVLMGLTTLEQARGLAV